MTLEETKESIRYRVWNYLEDNNLAQFPRPVFHRIPNFKGAEKACAKVQELEEFRKASVVKVNPDKPQQHVRFLTLEANKTLLVPTPRLKNGLFNQIVPPARASKRDLHICSTAEGVKRYSIPVGLHSHFKIDLVVLGSVAVSLSGHRIGKGEGFADLEYAMMTLMGAVNPDTFVVSTVHDCQVFETLPDHLFQDHDVPVDIIVTPTRVIRCCPRLPKPSGIKWSILTEEKLNQIPVLKILRREEEKAGKDVTLKTE